MLVSWQAIYRKWSGLFSVIYVVATSTADYLSNSLHLQELGVTTKHPTHRTKTCISQGTLPVTKICCINRNTTQRFQIYLSVTFTPDFVWALNLKAKLEWWSHLCSQTLNIIDFALILVSVVSVNSFWMYMLAYVAMVPFAVLSKTLWNSFAFCWEKCLFLLRTRRSFFVIFQSLAENIVWKLQKNRLFMRW